MDSSDPYAQAASSLEGRLVRRTGERGGTLDLPADPTVGTIRPDASRSGYASGCSALIGAGVSGLRRFVPALDT